MKELHLPTGETALVDDADYERVSTLRWHALKRPQTTYAASSQYSPIHKCQRTIYLHRFILQAGARQLVDHIDRDGLNNQRSNLRFADWHLNQGNRIKIQSKIGRKFKGTNFLPFNPRNPWQARIRVRGKLLRLGVHPTEEDAARAYNEAALRFFGEFARLNEV